LLHTERVDGEVGDAVGHDSLVYAGAQGVCQSLGLSPAKDGGGLVASRSRYYVRHVQKERVLGPNGIARCAAAGACLLKDAVSPAAQHGTYEMR
jgi:hypothetical protein